MTMLMEPLAPWLRDLNRFITADSAPAPFIPPADVVVSDAGVTVYMDVPGLGRDELEIDLGNDTLTVRGERRFPYQAQEGERVWRHVERRFGRFERTLRVPPGLDADTVEAELSDGVLTLRVPKPETLKPHRVEIRPGAATSAGGNGGGQGAAGASGTTADAGAAQGDIEGDASAT